MAIAGVHNVSVLDSSFLRESPSQSPRQVGEDGRVSTRASSVLRMWRELEDEHVVSRAQERLRERLFQQRSDSFCPELSRTDSSESHGSDHSGESEDASVGENDQDVSGSCTSEQSSDLGEQRGRVRQVSREWMSSGAGEFVPNVSQANTSPRAEWLGETEQERVRVIREWTQTNSQSRGTSGGGRESQPSGSGSQIERIRDGLVVNQNEGRNQHVRRGIRRLCGRQALLDMVKKAEMERKTELQGLLEHRAVTNFPHRNRIQSLLRGWFLRNGRSTEKGRPSSIAESELGLLRQKHTVSGLRGEFISRLDSSASAQASGSLSDTSNDDSNSNINVQTRENNEYEIINDICEQSESNYGGSDDQENEIHGTSNGRDEFGGNNVGRVNSEESNARLEEVQHDQVPDNAHSRDWQWSPSVESDERRESTAQNLDVQSLEDSANTHTQDASQSGGVVNTNLEEPVDVAGEQSESNREVNDSLGFSGAGDNLEDNNRADDTRRQESASEEDLSSESEEQEWDQDVSEYTEWRDGVGENEGTDQQQTTPEIGWPLGNEENENRPMEEEESPEEWHEEGGFQEAVQSWLEEPSDQEAVPVRQADTFYFPDDDNVYSTELRELLSRRRVSNLLHSGFRESLNQLIQSYVERQGNAATDWELNGSPPPEPAERDQDQPGPTQTEALRNPAVDRPPISLPLPAMRSPPTWDQESQHDNWTQHVMHQRLGIEWEIINDMRIDMARLQQRMNNLQRMLETCMDMQLELQRSIRQEVSSALNRSSDSQVSGEVGFPCDDSKWDHVRKGICCVCCDNSIDSLLYRCGHMCACANCANELVESRGKCPMCRAPVVEVIRAYSIL